jgi:signal transduction histidine kinase/CheY-like chemotaxis protein
MHFLKVFAILSLSSAAFLTLIYMRFATTQGIDPYTARMTLEIVFVVMVVVIGLSSWAWVLVQESRRLAEEETESQTALLMEEIAAHERTDAALKMAKEAAEAANLAKTRFIAGLNHEVRTLLNSINGYAQLLENKSAIRPEDAIHVIRHSSEHVTRLMDELLDISRIEAGTMQLYRNVVPLHDFLEQAVNMVRLQAAAKGIEFRYRRDPQLPAYVFADEKRLRQILLNLLTNAIKYTERGYASLEVHYRNMIAEFVVSDTGIGIASEDLERVFEPFERGRSPGAAAVPGTGLGLTISRLLVRILGGDLTLESSAGSGSNFKVRLMLPAAEPKFVRKHSSDQKVIGYTGKRRSIVIADDDSYSLELMREILSPLGFAIFTASNGEACLGLLEKCHPDLVILDISMPGMNGWEVAKAVRAAGHREMAILMVSAEFLQLSTSLRREKDHDDYLVKPIEIPQLLDRLQTLLEIEWITESLERVP